MSTHKITKCNFCHEVLPDFRGANIVLVERFVSGDLRRAFPYESKKDLDLCEQCYEPFAKLFKEASSRATPAGF